MATHTQTEITTETRSTLKAQGVTADTNQYADLGKFSEPSLEGDYQQAVKLIESKLDGMAIVGSLFRVNLGSNQPDLEIDARGSGRASMIILPDTGESSTTKLYIRPNTIQRFIDGLMDARYAFIWGHIFVKGTTRVAIKFVDVLTGFEAIHPKLDRAILDQLPQPTEDIAQVKRDLKKWGYGLVKNALSPDELQKLQKRLKDQAKGEAEAGVGSFDGGESKPNQRLWCLHNKGQEFIDLLDYNKVIKELVPENLGDDAILFSYTANIAKPGNTPMHLHTDQISVSHYLM
jgi:hypothetical protein